MPQGQSWTSWPDQRPPGGGLRSAVLQTLSVFNPASLVAAWCLSLIALLALPWPFLMLGAGAVLALVTWLAAASLWHLLRRSRWLLLAVALMFGWMTPGMPTILPGATDEGLRLAAEQLARLLTSIAMVALLLRLLDPSALMSGLHRLMRPLAWFGVNVDRMVLRLALTLRYLDAAPDAKGIARQWLELPPDEEMTRNMEPVHLLDPPFRAVDLLLLLAASVFVIGVLA